MKTTYDYIIIGAGPAGLQLGYFLQKNKQNYLILEKSKHAGNFFRKFPRHGTLISINKCYTGFTDPEVNLRYDWNSLICDNPKLRFTEYTKEYFPSSKDLVKYCADFAKLNKLNIEYQADVIKIHKGKSFEVHLKSGETLRAKQLIVATGFTQPYIPNIPGIEHTSNYADMSLDKTIYRNKRVLIIGKGNSGFETADYLVDSASIIHIASPEPLKMAWQSHYVGHLRAINNNFLDTYQLKSQNGMINANIRRIDYSDNKYRVEFDYRFAHGETEFIEYDHVITCTGFEFDHSIFDECCKPALAICDRFPEMTSCFESRNIPNLYFVGVIMHMRDFKKKQSGFIHGFRYNVEFLANYLMQQYQKRPMPHTIIAFKAKALRDKVIEAVNHSSALWQQTGFICDAIVYCPKSQRFFYYPTIPTDFCHQSSFIGSQDYFTVTLDFGQDIIDKYPDVFKIERVHRKDYRKAYNSTFLHPIIRHYRNHEMVSEHHIIEDFDSVWREPEHTEPLLAYFARELATIYEPIKMQTKSKPKKAVLV